MTWAASLVSRAEAAGYRGIVVTLDTWVTGWRPRDLATSNFPQLRGLCLANYLTDGPELLGVALAEAGRFGPYPSDHLVKFTGAMFVADEVLLGVGFDAARAGLANLAHGGLLMTASAQAYGEGLTGVVRVGPDPSRARTPGDNEARPVELGGTPACGTAPGAS